MIRRFLLSLLVCLAVLAPSATLAACPPPVNEITPPSCKVTEPIIVFFPAEEWATAVYVRGRESSNLPWVVGAAGERGLFQIHPVHAARFDRFGGWDAAFDPWANTEVAAELWREFGWQPWSAVLN
jgi:hypothetical protein